jgi:hypothetical protein
MNQTFTTRWHGHRNWVLRHQAQLQAAYLVLMAIGIIADLVLVLVLRVESISSRVWDATAAHPTLIAAGVLATVLVCWLVHSSWRMVFFAGLLGGHLFIHW